MNQISRREIMRVCGLGILGATLPGFRRLAFAQGPVIRANSNYPRGQCFFDPIGLFIPKGEKVRWVFGRGYTVTAFHPANDNHELRIPENAKPFDSRLQKEQLAGGVGFEWTFDVEGTYDFFSVNHEILGMVGRIVVGTAGGPGEKNPPGYGAREGRAPVFPTQAEVFAACPSAEIVQKKIIRHPKDLLARPYPYAQQ